MLLPRNTSLPYSYKMPTVLSDDAPILRFAAAFLKPDGKTQTPGAWSKGINLHSYSLDQQETTKLFLESHPDEQESSLKYDIVYLRVENHLLQITVTILSPLRVLSMLQVPLEIQLHDDRIISSPVTPATTSVSAYLRATQHPEDRHQLLTLYSPFPFVMKNHFDYYDRDRPENKNQLYIRLRNKTAGIWGNWLRVPDVYYGQNYRLCRIHIPVDNENNFNYCYLVNKYDDKEKVNCLEMLPAAFFVNETPDELFFKQYINEGCVKPYGSGDNTARIDYNYILNDGVNNNLLVRPYLQASSVCSRVSLDDPSEWSRPGGCGRRAALLREAAAPLRELQQSLPSPALHDLSAAPLHQSLRFSPAGEFRGKSVERLAPHDAAPVSAALLGPRPCFRCGRRLWRQ